MEHVIFLFLSVVASLDGSQIGEAFGAASKQRPRLRGGKFCSGD